MPPRLKKRAEFKAAAKGVRAQAGEDLFTLQARRRDDDRGGPAPRVGFTVTKRIGNAVVRSRIKRRLRAISADCAGAFAPMTDYVLVARRSSLSAPYPALCEALGAAGKAVEAKLRRLEDNVKPAPPSPSG